MVLNIIPINLGAKVLKKKTDFGFQQISFGFLDYAPVFYCNPQASIRFDDVQDIYNQITPMADWARPFTNTLSVPFKLICNDSNLLSDRGYKIENEAHLTQAVESLEEIIQNNVFSWFLNFNELKKLNETINIDIESPINMFISEDERIFKGLIISNLINKTTLPGIVNSYRLKCEAILRAKDVS